MTCNAPKKENLISKEVKIQHLVETRGGHKYFISDARYKIKVEMIRLQQGDGNKKCRACKRGPSTEIGSIDDGGLCMSCYCYMCSPY